MPADTPAIPLTARVRDLLDKATPGPWHVGEPVPCPRCAGVGPDGPQHNIYDDENCDITDPHAHILGGNAALIASAPTLLRTQADLLDEAVALFERIGKCGTCDGTGLVVDGRFKCPDCLGIGKHPAVAAFLARARKETT